ncbi:MAG: STM4011 family radical SAM protein, partial [Gemmataceae bacterium]
FLAKCSELDRLGVRFSVGVVGLREHFADIRVLRDELPPHVYLWINAYKDQADYYRRDEEEWLASIDPLFPINNRRHLSLGRACRAGHTVVSVDGDGTVRRCHFIRAPLGNLYDPEFERMLAERPCTSATCGCHIGYVHMPELGLYEMFGDGVLERIPARPIWQDRDPQHLISLSLEAP